VRAVSGRGRRGVTLVECAVALAISSIILAAVWALLLAGWRTARAASATTAVRQGVRAAATVLGEELLGVSAGAGDILAISDSSLALRTTRGMGFLCAGPAGSAVVLSDSLLSVTRTVDPSHDSALVFREGDPMVSADDRWLHAGISSTRGSVCADGTSGTRLVLTGTSAADLAGVSAGAPVRIFEILEYRRYVDAAGLGWLGVRGPSSGGWAATSPLAGPLRPRDGVVFRFASRDGRTATVPGDVALVEVTVHGLDPRLLAAPGRPSRPSADSATLRAFVGGP
jgi:prepilin-type N-terminal cleavage/methylation domain-containing protein